jgi:hypothetical protein
MSLINSKCNLGYKILIEMHDVIKLHFILTIRALHLLHDLHSTFMHPFPVNYKKVVKLTVDRRRCRIVKKDEGKKQNSGIGHLGWC